MILAHENPMFKDRLPLQLKGNGCAIHCISFAVDVMSGHHASLTDAQTEPLRKVLRAILNTSCPFGTGRSYRNEWEARAAAMELKAKAAAQEQLEMDVPQEAKTSEADKVLMVEEADKEINTRTATLEHIDEMEIGGYSESQSSTTDQPSSLVDTSKPATQSKLVAQVSKTVAAAQESSDEMEIDGDYGAQSNRTGQSEERITLEAHTSRVNLSEWQRLDQEGSQQQNSTCQDKHAPNEIQDGRSTESDTTDSNHGQKKDCTKQGTSFRKQKRSAKAKDTQKRRRTAVDYF
jgi:hypothetical protein